MLGMTSLRMLLAVGLLSTIGCEADGPAVDAEAPVVTIAVARGRGDNIFTSEDDPGPVQECIKVSDERVKLSLAVTDSGGVETLILRALGGTIDPMSVELAPGSPESSFSIRRNGPTDILAVALSPPSPGEVRTILGGTLEFDADLPSEVSANSLDVTGNVANLVAFGVRALDDPVDCRDAG